MQGLTTVTIGHTKPIVYLDQWVWVQLSRASLGKNPDWVLAHEAVSKAAIEGRCAFPLSQSHVIETCKNTNTGSRGRLIDYIIPRWGQTHMLPWYMMAGLECRNAILASAGKPILDLRSHIFQGGLLRCFGANPTLKAKEGSKFIQEMADDLMGKLDGDALLQHLKEDKIAAGFAASWPDPAAWVKEVQGIANKDYEAKDKTQRNAIAEAKFMMFTVGEYLDTELTDMVDDRKTWMSKNLTSKEAIRTLRCRIPSLNTFWTLTHSRDRVKRPVQPNDMHDMQLALAIPYCDVVVTERTWSRAAQEAGLDDLYETRICSDADSLADAVSRLR